MWAEGRLGVCWERRLGPAGRSPGCVGSAQELEAESVGGGAAPRDWL